MKSKKTKTNNKKFNDLVYYAQQEIYNNLCFEYQNNVKYSITLFILTIISLFALIFVSLQYNGLVVERQEFLEKTHTYGNNVYITNVYNTSTQLITDYYNCSSVPNITVEVFNWGFLDSEQIKKHFSNCNFQYTKIKDNQREFVIKTQQVNSMR